MLRQRDKSGYLSEDTIAAIATAVGGAISIVRVSGKEAFSTLNLLTGSSSSSQSEPRKLIRSSLLSQTGEVLDDALFVRFVSPHSYTGEDLVEYHLHGGGFICQRVMETLAEQGVRQALPGEFSFRGVRNGKFSLYQAQAVADLISASNNQATSLALEKLSGAQNEFLDALATGLRQVAALGEVGIDFADQDVEEVSLPHLKKKLQPLLSTLQTLQQSYSRGLRLQEGIRVAFVGLPNAGKSSFFNALLGEDRSIVSDIAGTTRDVVREKLTLRGKGKTITLRLEDTAGLRTTEDRIEKMGIERTVQSIQNADLVLFILDPTSSREAALEQWNFLQGHSPGLAGKTLGILTKQDLNSSRETFDTTFLNQTFGISIWAATSAVTRSGIPEAIDQLVEFCERWTNRSQGEVVLTRLDHVSAVNEAIEHIQRGFEAPEIDLFASDIRQALHSLEPLIGQTLPDDILGKIFSDFCIGK